MFDQIKTVFTTPVETKSFSASPKQANLANTAAFSVKESKNDVSTAFERSGWVYI